MNAGRNSQIVPAVLVVSALLACSAGQASAQLANRHGHIMWQAGLVGGSLGGFAGFAIGSHIDRRSDGGDPGAAAALLTLGGVVGGGLGGLIVGSGSDAAPGQLGLAATAVFWTGALTVPIQFAMEQEFDMRSSVFVGLTSGLVAWHLWEDIPMTRGRVWIIDLSGAVGTVVGALVANAVDSTNNFDPNNQQDFQEQQAEEDRNQAIAFASTMALSLAFGTWIAITSIPDRHYKAVQRRTWDVSFAPSFDPVNDRPGLALVGRF